jgi:hypothetical protein
MIRVIEVVDPKHLRDFLKVPARVYQDDPAWVPPMPSEREAYFNRTKNPIFRQKEVALWVAYDGDHPVGRISGQRDRGAAPGHAGHFGCLECVDDEAAFAMLFDAAEAWLRRSRAAEMSGPYSLSINDECGLLVDGFTTPPSFMMPHGKPYYAPHLDRLKFKKTIDLLAYDYDLANEFRPIAKRILERARGNPRIRVRAVQPKDFAGQVAAIISVFNDGWSGNWGFEPISNATADLMAKSVKPLLMRNMVWIADFDEVPAAVAINLPNLNEALIRLRRPGVIGKWIGFARQLIFKDFTTARTPLIGIRREYHRSNLGAELAMALMDASRSGALSHGITHSELSWVLENNMQMRRIIEEVIGGVAYKTYRIFSKAII